MTYSPRGTSMLPLIKQGRDMFTVCRKGDGRCQKYDVVLYRRPPDKYVLHRIVKVLPESYVLLGDNCMNKEYNILDRDIIGVMTGYVRKGKEHNTSEFRYRAYSRIIVMTFPLRRSFRVLRSKIRRLLKR